MSMPLRKKQKIYRALGKKIRNLRMDKGVSQETLANYLGYKSRVTVSQIESGGYKVSVVALQKMSDYFQVPVYELMQEDETTSRDKDLTSFLKQDEDLTSADIEKIVGFIGFVKDEKKK